MLKKVKVKKIKKVRIAKRKYAFLIYRYYRDTYIKQFIVCINYSLRKNIYEEGYIFKQQYEADIYFNDLVTHKNFDFITKKQEVKKKKPIAQNGVA